MGQPSRIIDLPSSPMLRPGSRIARRDERYLQVGIDLPRRAVLPDIAEVRKILGDLRDGHTPTVTTEVGAAAVTSLIKADLVVPQHPARLRSAQFGAAVDSRMDRLARSTVRLRATSACAGWGGEVSGLLEEHGVRWAPEGVGADVTIVLASGEAPRELLDELLRAGTPYLLVVSRAGGVEIGPFVDPGRSACHRCVEAHRAESDPRRTLILEQVIRQIDQLQDEPMDPLLMRWAAAWAVRDVCRRLEGDDPSTLSASYVVGPDGPPETFSWTRHPHCGCSWAADFGLVAG